MKILAFGFFVVFSCMISGIIIAEMSYIILLLIKYFAYGYMDFSLSEILKGLRVGGGGGGILGSGIVLFRLLKIKGFQAQNVATDELAGGATSSYLKGDDPLKGGVISGAASGLGYGVGKLTQGQLDKVLNPNWKNWEWVDVGMGISKPMPLNPLPGITGNAIGSGATEFTNNQVGKKIDEISGKK